MALFPVTLSDPYLPPNHPVFAIFISIHIFVVGGVRDFEFGR